MFRVSAVFFRSDFFLNMSQPKSACCGSSDKTGRNTAVKRGTPTVRSTAGGDATPEDLRFPKFRFFGLFIHDVSPSPTVSHGDAGLIDSHSPRSTTDSAVYIRDLSSERSECSAQAIAPTLEDLLSAAADAAEGVEVDGISHSSTVSFSSQSHVMKCLRCFHDKRSLRRAENAG